MTEMPTHDAGEAGETSAPRDAGADAVARVLANADSHARSVTLHGGRAAALRVDNDGAHDRDGDQFDREDRAALRRVGGLSTELEDVTEVEYRQLRLENVILIGIYAQGALDEAENSLRELAALAETAGAVVLDGLLQRRPNPDPSTYLGKGKAAELALIVKELGADTVIADTELAPSQRRALEDVVKVKVIDRTAVILDIFSQHAKSREGKAQVELAQLEYLLPRLRGWGDSMSRQAGGQVGGAGAGMGSRGPGETKIERSTEPPAIHTANGDSCARHSTQAFARARAPPKRANREPASARCAERLVRIAGRTTKRGQVRALLKTRLTRAGVARRETRIFATLDPRTRVQQERPTPEGPPLDARPKRSASCAPAAPAGRGLPLNTGGVADSDVIMHVIERRLTPTPRPSSRRCGMFTRGWMRAKPSRNWYAIQQERPAE